MDDFIDELLHEERCCDVILPRIQVSSWEPSSLHGGMALKQQHNNNQPAIAYHTATVSSSIIWYRQNWRGKQAPQDVLALCLTSFGCVWAMAKASTQQGHNLSVLL